MSYKPLNSSAHSLLNSVSQFIDAEHLLCPGDSVVVALSGGADSSALLVILSKLGYRCIAVHCHFGLRGDEADRDLEHSHQLAKSFGAEFRSTRFDTHAYMREHGISAEMACRELRYAYFETVRQQVGAAAIAVGHHCEDNVETFFLNLLRGSGLHGLRAMLPKRGHIIRPLLNETKAELAAYLCSLGIPFVVDSTNAQNYFKRNRIRNILMPLLEQQFPGASEAIVQSLKNLRGNEELYNSLIPPPSHCLQGISPTLLHEWLAPYGFNSSQCEQMLTANAGAEFFSASHKVDICPKHKFRISPVIIQSKPPRITRAILAPPVKFRPGCIYLDADAAVGNFGLRPWQEGDRIRPFGMRGSRMVSDILAEAGIAASERKNSYVLTLNEDIIWVVGIRASALYPITDKTKHILEISHENN